MLIDSGCMLLSFLTLIAFFSGSRFPPVSFLHSVSKYLLSPYYVIGTVPSAGVNKPVIFSVLMEFLFLGQYICVLVAGSEEQAVNSI